MHAGPWAYMEKREKCRKHAAEKIMHTERGKGMLEALAVTGILCLCSLGVILVIPFFARTRYLMAFLPRDVREAAKDHPDPPPGKRVIGYLLVLAFAAVFAGGYVFLGADGLRRGYGFGRLFVQFMIVLYGYKLFDIVVQDQYLVITRRYFVRFYPETRDCPGWRDRSFNTRKQLIRLAVFPFSAALMAGITLWIGG